MTRQTSQRIAVVYRIDVGSVEAVTPQREFFVVGEGVLPPSAKSASSGRGAEVSWRGPPPSVRSPTCLSIDRCPGRRDPLWQKWVLSIKTDYLLGGDAASAPAG